MNIILKLKCILKNCCKHKRLGSNFNPESLNNYIGSNFDIDSIDIKLFSSEDLVKLAYLVLLRRKIDEGALRYWQQRIEFKSFYYFELLDGIYSSVEFAMNRVDFMGLLHRGRQKWCKSLGKFDYVFDIGGSSANIDMGALIELGYSYRPKEIIIFDLPEEEQYWGKPKFPQDRDYIFEWGTIKYEHGHIEDIYNYKSLGNKQFNLIYMGQTIEHIHKDKLKIVLKWIKEHLRHDGKFIFDTPNRAITSIQSPTQYIDSDHKYEYTPVEMEKILSQAGFIVVKKTGILYMPETLASGKFNPTEVINYNLLSTTAEASYVFAFECQI